ncbi:MAG: ATP-binding cassette domain-containing protein, partial [Rhodobacteraceae bacterium]|nr:ATP-binding cassette domain-containing protein [Paracoccaceae bacterium]
MSKLAVVDLAVRYGKLTAVSEASFALAEGARVFLTGPNGAGKSSLLGAIAGAVRAAHGRVEIDGEIVSGRGAEDIARHGLSMVPEGRRIFAGLSVRENLLVGTGLRRDREAV